jgi:translation initiation factor 2-alpha kinase 3
MTHSQPVHVRLLMTLRMKVRNHLDNQEYAIKKILITSQRVQKFLEKDQLEALLDELRTLAKLNHTNIVRYFHGWIETTPANTTVRNSLIIYMV